MIIHSKFPKKKNHSESNSRFGRLVHIYNFNDFFFFCLMLEPQTLHIYYAPSYQLQGT